MILKILAEVFKANKKAILVSCCFLNVVLYLLKLLIQFVLLNQSNIEKMLINHFDIILFARGNFKRPDLYMAKFYVFVDKKAHYRC